MHHVCNSCEWSGPRMDFEAHECNLGSHSASEIENFVVEIELENTIFRMEIDEEYTCAQFLIDIRPSLPEGNFEICEKLTGFGVPLQDYVLDHGTEFIVTQIQSTEIITESSDSETSEEDDILNETGIFLDKNSEEHSIIESRPTMEKLLASFESDQQNLLRQEKEMEIIKVSMEKFQAEQLESDKSFKQWQRDNILISTTENSAPEYEEKEVSEETDLSIIRAEWMELKGLAEQIIDNDYTFPRLQKFLAGEHLPLSEYRSCLSYNETQELICLLSLFWNLPSTKEKVTNVHSGRYGQNHYLSDILYVEILSQIHSQRTNLTIDEARTFVIGDVVDFRKSAHARKTTET